MEGKELRRGHMAYDKVHAIFTNQGSTEEGTTTTASCNLTGAMVQSGYGSNVLGTEGTDRGRKSWELEDQGRRPR